MYLLLSPYFPIEYTLFSPNFVTNFGAPTFLPFGVNSPIASKSALSEWPPPYPWLPKVPRNNEGFLHLYAPAVRRHPLSLGVHAGGAVRRGVKIK